MTEPFHDREIVEVLNRMMNDLRHMNAKTEHGQAAIKTVYAILIFVVGSLIRIGKQPPPSPLVSPVEHEKANSEPTI
jgi:hypothetical protein